MAAAESMTDADERRKRPARSDVQTRTFSKRRGRKFVSVIFSRRSVLCSRIVDARHSRESTHTVAQPHATIHAKKDTFDNAVLYHNLCREHLGALENMKNTLPPMVYCSLPQF